ncbi:bifunctional 4-hydroxy-2-oxoglutarate aldolase/2-dehydro-3-deoxy-phosphogluconate aldolase [Plantactinospora endophytica]|uniref:2-dehydro-3-deoxy-6-phosphogalactonate aldolase n=1 Tax=Plantactinospora endophytica TaxID=673535 RepID=A0ABQ4DX57_9ACTN|nr:bifunctional 4-hydroxy-2-oxoglutarate aldolase/2-dehydro-3-deoxy-phosphogluconate aldolase [Plantactinospora endophytica]GIG87036.1 2-dehydro-3-deoxy-6-phosphogalactonate aldolase [Plantactinospora endophytica]
MSNPSTAYFDDLFAGQPVMAILRGFDPAGTVALCERAWAAGIDVVEVPVQSPDALPSLHAAVAAGRDRGRPVGAGTVVTPDQVRTVYEAGAAFTVAPGYDPEVAAECSRLGLAHLPGVATSSEIGRALRTGHTWLKAFPASELGTGWIRAQLAPFPTVKFVATGGVDADNAEAFLGAGCRVVAVGSALQDPRQLDLLGRLTAHR